MITIIGKDGKKYNIKRHELVFYTSKIPQIQKYLIYIMHKSIIKIQMLQHILLLILMMKLIFLTIQKKLQTTYLN